MWRFEGIVPVVRVFQCFFEEHKWIIKMLHVTWLLQWTNGIKMCGVHVQVCACVDSKALSEGSLH